MHFPARPLVSLVILIAVSLACSASRPLFAQDVADWPDEEAIVEGIRLPEIPDRQTRITDYGAHPGGTSDARGAIQTAIEDLSQEGGGRVVIPSGTWLSRGPIHLASRIDLHLEQGAVLRFSPDARDYLPVVLTRWEGTELYGYSPLIYAFEVHDVAITGLGTIDGNAESEFFNWVGELQEDDQLALRRLGQDGTGVEERVFGEGTHLRPSLIQFFRAERVLLEDYTALNSPFWVNHLVYAEDATVRRVRVDSHHPNNDGVDVDSSRDVVIEHCWFRTGDDAVVVKSGRDRDGRDIGRPSENVVVRHNDMGGEDGIALGSEMSGGIRNVYFTDNILRSGSSAIRFKANLDRGGIVEHIRVRNFTVGEFENLFWFQLDYPGLLGGGHPSTYRDIVFENFAVERAGTVFDANAPAAAPLRDVTLRNVTIETADRTFLLKNVEDLTLEGVVIGGQRVDGTLDWREAGALSDE